MSFWGTKNPGAGLEEVIERSWELSGFWSNSGLCENLVECWLIHLGISRYQDIKMSDSDIKFFLMMSKITMVYLDNLLQNLPSRWHPRWLTFWFFCSRIPKLERTSVMRMTRCPFVVFETLGTDWSSPATPRVWCRNPQKLIGGDKARFPCQIPIKKSIDTIQNHDFGCFKPVLPFQQPSFFLEQHIFSLRKPAIVEPWPRTVSLEVIHLQEEVQLLREERGSTQVGFHSHGGTPFIPWKILWKPQWMVYSIPCWVPPFNGWFIISLFHGKSYESGWELEVPQKMGNPQNDIITWSKPIIMSPLFETNMKNTQAPGVCMWKPGNTTELCCYGVCLKLIRVVYIYFHLDSLVIRK